MFEVKTNLTKIEQLQSSSFLLKVYKCICILHREVSLKRLGYLEILASQNLSPLVSNGLKKLEHDLP